MCGALSDERMDIKLTRELLLGFATAAILGPESRRTHDHILLFHLRLPQPGGPGPRISIPQEHGGPVSYTPWNWVPFPSPLTTLRSAVEVFEPASTKEKKNPWPESASELYRPSDRR
jgi:hypothetical protein